MYIYTEENNKIMDSLVILKYIAFVGIGFILGRISMAIQMGLQKPNDLNNKNRK